MIKARCYIDSNGTKEWYLNDKYHRKDGPAIEYRDGTKMWCINDHLHREDGPAVEYADGSRYWYIKGKNLTEEEFRKWQIKNRNKKIKALDL